MQFGFQKVEFGGPFFFTSDIGCHIGSTYIGALSCANTLLFPSIHDGMK